MSYSFDSNDCWTSVTLSSDIATQVQPWRCCCYTAQSIIILIGNKGISSLKHSEMYWPENAKLLDEKKEVDKEEPNYDSDSDNDSASNYDETENDQTGHERGDESEEDNECHKDNTFNEMVSYSIQLNIYFPGERLSYIQNLSIL